jgi:tRNA threonylcarbamoyladenosine biosynthesis protein TsaB
MLLAIDTSTTQIGVALCAEDAVISESAWSSAKHHTVELAPAIQDLLRRAGATHAAIEALAVAVGPGSYTALRVGMALAKGLALSLNVPLIGVGTLDIIAAGVPTAAARLAVVLRAGRGRIAVGFYTAVSTPTSILPWQLEEPVIVTTAPALAKSIEKPTLVAGELTSEERQRLARKKVNVTVAASHLCIRRPSVLGALAWDRRRRGEVDEPASLAPVYLSVAEPATS